MAPAPHRAAPATGEVVRHGAWNLPGEFALGDIGDDGLERLARGLRHRLEDITGGCPASTADRHPKAPTRIRHELVQIEGEQSLRAALRFRGAREDGTHLLAEYEAAGGMRLSKDESGGSVVVCDCPPSYPLAFMLDYRQYRDGGVSVLDWASVEAGLGRERATETIARLWLGGVA